MGAYRQPKKKLQYVDNSLFVKKFELAWSWWLGITTKRLQCPTVGEPPQCSLRLTVCVVGLRATWWPTKPNFHFKHLLWTFQNKYNIGADLRKKKKKKVLFVTPIFVYHEIKDCQQHTRKQHKWRDTKVPGTAINTEQVNWTENKRQCPQNARYGHACMHAHNKRIAD